MLSEQNIPPPQASIGPYRVHDRLGQGGMGVVYRASHRQTGQVVALKTVTMAQNSMVESLRREIFVLTQISHPGIVRVLEAGVQEGLPWYAMELLEGHTLRVRLEHELEAGLSPDQATQRIIKVDGTKPGLEERHRPTPRRLQPLSAEALLAWLELFRRACAPLAWLHGEGILHRDLKPENILIRPDGSPVLLDFGLFTLFRGEGNRDAVMLDEEQAGSSNYMAPEQLSGATLDARTDLYALGCILYEVLTGTPPFAHISPIAIAVGHLHKAPTPPSELVPGIPPQLDALVLRLLAKKPGDRLGYAEDLARALSSFGLSPTRPAEPSPRPYLYRARLVGRDGPLEELRSALVSLQEGEGQVVLVGGESGIGKTRLVSELGRQASREDTLVISGRCRDTGGEPLEGLRLLLQHLAVRCRSAGLEETERLLGHRGKLLALYEPSLLGLPGQDRYAEPAELPSPMNEERLCRWLVDTLIALAQEQFVLLIIDDLQWADPLMLAFMSYVVTRKALKRSGVLLLGTWRSEETPTSLSALLGLPELKTLMLGRLEDAAVWELVRDMMAQPSLPRYVAASLARLSEGNPFFVSEYLRVALDEGLLWRDPLGRWQLPPSDSESSSVPYFDRLGLPRSLMELVARRIEGLPEEVLRVVKAACVMGRSIRLGLLEHALGMAQASLFRAIQELLRRQVLEEAVGGGLRFTHEKLREIAYARVPLEERRALHAAVARAIEALYPSGRERAHALLGYHWEQGGNHERARACYIAGAFSALAHYAYADAEQAAKNAFRLQVRPEVASIQLRTRIGHEVIRVSGRFQEAAEEHLQALQEAKILGYKAGAAISLYHLAMLRRGEGQLEQALAHVMDGLGYVTAESHPLETGLLSNALALVAVDQGRFEDAEAIFRRALALLERSGETRYLGIGLANFGTMLHSLDRLEEAAGYYEQGIVALRKANARLQVALLMSNLGTYHLEQGHISEAQKTLEESRTIQAEVGDRAGQASTLSVLSMLYRQGLGELESAERTATESVTLLREHGALPPLLFSLCELGHVRLAQGREANEQLLEARDILESCQLGSTSEHGRRVAELDASIEALKNGEPLFRGNRLSAIPPGLEKVVLAQGLERRRR